MNESNEILTELIIKSTEATSLLKSSVENLHTSIREHEKDTRTYAANNGAKLDNLDRSLGELRLVLERAELTRSEEFKRIFELLSEERGDRRRAVEDQVESAKNDDVRAVFKQLLSEERGDRKEEAQRDYLRAEENRGLLKVTAKALWDKGGQWVVFALCILLIMSFQKCSGVDILSMIPR